LKIIKFDYPVWWNEVGGNFKEMLPNEHGIINDCQFYINDNSIKDADYWFICEDTGEYLPKKVNCPRRNCILITNEAESMWNYREDYLRQFGRIMTSRSDIRGSDIIQQQHLSPWHIKKNYNYLKESEYPTKTNALSGVVSDAVELEGHKRRYRLMNRLKGHFKDELYWYGRGEMEIQDKWDGLAPYKYSIAIENSSHHRYFTEKITDVYLSYSMPIYWGCPNITDYFSSDSMVILEDIDDYKRCIQQIEEAIDSGRYEMNFSHILEARNLILDKYQPFTFLANWISLQEVVPGGYKQKVSIYEKSFFSREKTIKQKLYFYYYNIFHVV
jgi:hypothetical protein